MLAQELACSRGVSHGQLYSLELSVLHTIMFTIIIPHCKCTKTQTLVQVLHTVNHVSAKREMLTKPVIKTLKNGKIFCTLSATVGTALVCSCKGSNSSTVYFTGCISQSERESVGDLASASACCRVLMLPLSGNE